ncbi:MAG: DNA mismatch repair protein MutS [Candidatus Omnitrophica bacterium]|nr:DNA mismatch repair protein MutS [Candidatus Omnitrophota bacterium]
MKSGLTPMMRQYLDIKQGQKDAILFFRLGDFYEMFFDDALEAAKILHITLTSRGAGEGNKVPMCGIPHHAADSYIARLIRQGKKVAICEQVEESTPGKKLVDRGVTRIITPGTFIADELLESSLNNYILSLTSDDGVFGLAYADLSTGEFRVTELSSKEELSSELFKISPTECLIPESFSKTEYFKEFAEINVGVITKNEDWLFDTKLSNNDIKRHFEVESLEGFGCGDMPLALGAAGALLKYLEDTQKTTLSNIDVISTYRADQFMSMDRNTYRHLELTQNNEDLSSKNTLFGVLNVTKTPMGKRRLKQWILYPLLEIEKINERLDVIEHFHGSQDQRGKVRELLADIYDVERLSNKVSLGSANARDMRVLAASLKNVKILKKILSEDAAACLKNMVSGLGDFETLIERIENCLEENPPITIKDGGLIKKGYDEKVDELKEMVSEGKDWVAELQKREIERTGVSSLKVGFNKVFGYYIEVTRSNIKNVPEDYMRKQTLVNAERFVTKELKEKEFKIIGAEERLKNLEYDIFCALRGKIGSEIERLKNASSCIAKMDVLTALAEIAVKNSYCRPKVNYGELTRIVDGRHPVLEKILRGKEFVSNDVSMNSNGDRIFIITGSNMAGKSTFIRQTALIAIMAQMGSFVPAREVELGVVDKVFTRVGASDRLYQGMSTFMVEMLETANILNNATGKSLIILDEIGRGTSTYDGVSIAWAVVEFMHHKIAGSKVMFATHYHELTELAEIMEGVKNYHLAVQEWGNDIVFLYRATEGSCDESFGIHVAKLAGMPKHVVERAREILNNLRKDSATGNTKSRFSEKDRTNEKQMDLFEQSFLEHPVIDKIKRMDMDNMTPMEALKKIAEFKKTLGEETK